MKKFRMRRIYVLGYTVVFSLAILFALSQMYDDFNRNPSIDETNKSLIETYLSDEDRRMLIDENIPTNRFIRFIRSPGFSLANFEYYEVIDNNSDLSMDEVVDKGNQLVNLEFTLSSLRTILGDRIYNVDQLIALGNYTIEHPDMNVVFFPNELLALSNFNHYVSTYSPRNLVEIDKSYVLNEASRKVTVDTNLALTNLCNALQLLNNKPCGGLLIKNAYISAKSLTNHPESYPEFMKPGLNDLQLGRSILLVDDHTATNPAYLWLLENAQNFGFVQRFPLDKSDITHVENQPFIFRYVGVENATNMHNNNLVLEEMS